MSIVSALPFILTNGQVADATQVMADFNQIVNQVNTNALALAGGTLTGPLTLNADAASSLQATTLQQVNAAIAAALAGTTTTFAAAAAPVAALTPGFNAWELDVLGLIPSGAPTITWVVSFDGGLTYKTGPTDYAWSQLTWNNAAGANYSIGTTSVPLVTTAMDNTASKANDWTFSIFGPLTAGFGTSFRTIGQFWQGGGNSDLSIIVNGQIVPGYGVPTHIKLVPSTGTLTGAFRVRGAG
jgi:hypothetical protein